jgi:hypothetical protein
VASLLTLRYLPLTALDVLLFLAAAAPLEHFSSDTARMGLLSNVFDHIQLTYSLHPRNISTLAVYDGRVIGLQPPLFLDPRGILRRMKVKIIFSI